MEPTAPRAIRDNARESGRAADCVFAGQPVTPELYGSDSHNVNVTMAGFVIVDRCAQIRQGMFATSTALPALPTIMEA
jgi:hypothetical protein